VSSFHALLAQPRPSSSSDAVHFSFLGAKASINLSVFPVAVVSSFLALLAQPRRLYLRTLSTFLSLVSRPASISVFLDFSFNLLIAVIAAIQSLSFPTLRHQCGEGKLTIHSSFLYRL
jgi:hypothetical protein